MILVPITLLMESVNSSDPILQMNDKYIPGKCNLGYEEINSRKKKFLIGFVITILTILCIQLFDFPVSWRSFVFFPVFFTLICFYQTRQKFCVVFGIMGIFNFERIGKSTIVENVEYKRKDLINSWLIIFKSLLVAFLIAGIYFLLP